MEPVGFLGIFKLTGEIILKNFKHFLCIAVLLALPNALNLILLDPPSTAIQSLVASMSKLYKLMHGQLPSPDESASTYMQPQPNYPPALIPALIFSITVSLACRPLICFSVCRACLKRSLDLKGSLQGIRRSVMNLVLTVLCETAALIGFVVVAMVVMAVIAGVLSAMKADLAVPVSIWALGMVVGMVYLTVCFSLADTVAVLEEEKGWEAMRRSMHLLGGRKWLAFWLSCVFTVMSVMLLPLSVSKEAPLLWRWSLAAASLGLQTFLVLFSMCAHVVLYMSCKSYRQESLTTLLPLTTQFGPQEFSAKYVDLEAVATNPTAL